MGEYIFQLKSVHFVTPTRTVQYFNTDDVILIGEDSLSRQMWKILKTHEIKDERIRSVTIKTHTGVIKQAIQMFYPEDTHGEILNGQTSVFFMNIFLVFSFKILITVVSFSIISIYLVHYFINIILNTF